MLQVGKFVISEIKYRLKFCYILPNSPGCEQKRRREREREAQIEICFSEAVSKFHVLDIVVLYLPNSLTFNIVKRTSS